MDRRMPRDRNPLRPDYTVDYVLAIEERFPLAEQAPLRQTFRLKRLPHMSKAASLFPQATPGSCIRPLSGSC
jgi:hypothetical protein